MTAAARKRRHRARRKAGLAVLRVVADPVHLAAVLTGAGYLAPSAPDEPADLEAPLSRLLADMQARDLV